MIAGARCSAQTETLVWGNSFGYFLTNVPPEATNILQLSAGDNHVLALRRDGTVVTWGANYLGQTNAPADLTNVINIATGSTHSMALRSDGTLSFWGRFFNGVGTTPPTATNIVALGQGPGPTHAVVLRADGTAVDWGDTNYSYTNMPSDAVDLVSVAGGSFHSVGLRADGRVVAWGNNSYGQLSVPSSATNIVAIACGYISTVALRANGTLLVWGTAPPNSSFTNILDMTCPFDSLSGTGNGVLCLRADGTLLESQGTPIPAYPTNQIGIIGSGGADALVAVGTGAPMFTGLPVNHTVPATSGAYFRAVAAGQVPISYQWACNGTNLPGATNSAFVLTNVQPELAGTSYTLTASNALGSTNFGPMYLQVNPLEIVMSPRSQTVLAGSSPTSFTGTPLGKGPFTYQWQFAGTNLPGKTTRILSLSNVQMNQSGTYALIASNAFGLFTNYDAMLNVLPLTVSIQPPANPVVVGTNADFTAVTTGQGPFTYQWRLNGTNIDGATSNVFTVTNIYPERTGPYSVIASNNFGTAASAPVTINLAPAWIRNQPQAQTVALGASAVFSVSVDSYVPLTYQWKYNGTNIPDATMNPLVVTNVQFENAGQFSVIVSNAYGTLTSSNAALTVVPLQIVTSPQDQPGYVGLDAVLSVVPQFQGPFTYQWFYEWMPVSGATNDQLVLTNLQIANSGHYSVLVSNALGSVQSPDAFMYVRAVATWGVGADQMNVPYGFSNAIAITANSGFSMALTSEHVITAWGLDTFFLGLVPSDLTNAINIALGTSHCLALLPDGTVRVWGSYFDGVNYYPAVAPTGLTNIVAIASGDYHALALRSDGTVATWGYGFYGQTNVPPNLTNVVAISAGGSFSLALKNDGTVTGWGGQGWGETNFPPGLSNVVAISAGVRHALALKSDGTVIGWGDDTFGQTDVPLNLGNVVAVAAGYSFSSALRGDGSIVVWGTGPTNVPPNLTTARAIAAGDGLLNAIPGTLPKTQPVSVSRQGTNVSLSFPSQSGRVYQLEYKDSLTDPIWKTAPLAAGNGGVLGFINSAPQSNQRFYRVRQW